jgi:hypothetical protein
MSEDSNSSSSDSSQNGDEREEDEREEDAQETIRRLEEQVKTITGQLAKLSKTQRNDSDTDTTSVAALKLSDVSKELMKLIPRYDGSGGIQKFFEFSESFEDFVGSAELTTQTELTIATAKLTGDAKLWWREHKKSTLIDSVNRIRNWDMLQMELRKTFVPVEAEFEIRRKIHNIRQRGSVAEYNAAFRKLSMQVTMEFEEAKFAYLQGLSPKIRDLVRTKDNLTDIRELQLACLKLDNIPTQSEYRDDSSALMVNTSSRNKPRNLLKHPYTSERSGRGRGHRNYQKGESRKPGQLSTITCYFCNEKGHKAFNCPKKAEAKFKNRIEEANLTII